MPERVSEPTHVLVVEDEVLAALAIEDYLGRLGYRVTLAGDGVEGLERQRNDPAHIVVTDIRMPRMDGLRLIRELRRLDPALPIVVMTGYLAADTSLGEAGGSDAASVVEVLRKPVDPRVIHQTLRRLLPARDPQSDPSPGT